MNPTSIYTVALLLISGIVLAETETDNQLWTSAGIRYRPAKSWTIKGTQNIRFDNNMSSFQSFKPQLELSYSPYNWLEIGSGYRFAYENDKDSEVVTSHRYHAQMVIERKWGLVKLSYRLRYQQKREIEDLDITAQIRNRVKLTYDTKTFCSPLFSAEVFADEAIETRKTRLTLGGSAKVSRSHRLFAVYQYQTYMSKDEVDRIFLLKYEYRIPEKRDPEEQKNI